MDEGSSKGACGIIMPISGFEGYTATHWTEVFSILTNATEAAGFEASMVNEADDVGIIHKRIVQNLYSNPIVICDVSGKNPNVMFELGMRLAFDKPTIIIKDDTTSYNFDTSPIEHLEYPRDLRYQKIVSFKETLATKIERTYQAAAADPNFSTFLKHFGDFQVAKIDEKEVSGQEIILQEIRALRESVIRQGSPRKSIRASPMFRPGSLNACMRGISLDEVKLAVDFARSYPGVSNVNVLERSPGHYHLLIKSDLKADLQDLNKHLEMDFPNRISLNDKA